MDAAFIMRSDERVTECIHRDDAAVNFAIPVFSLSRDGGAWGLNLIFAPDNHILDFLAKLKISSDAVHAHRSSVKLIQVF